MIRRKARDVERFAGMDRFLVEIDRRGYRAVENSGPDRHRQQPRPTIPPPARRPGFNPAAPAMHRHQRWC